MQSGRQAGPWLVQGQDLKQHRATRYIHFNQIIQRTSEQGLAQIGQYRVAAGVGIMLLWINQLHLQKLAGFQVLQTRLGSRVHHTAAGTGLCQPGDHRCQGQCLNDTLNEFCR